MVNRVGERKINHLIVETIRLNSKGTSVETLQKMLFDKEYSVAVTGTFDEATRLAVIEFQRLHELGADGIVGYRTWETLFFAKRGESKELSEEDFNLAAQLLDVESAALKAVKEVESGRYGGFLPSGRPVILFEGHIFWNQLKKRELDPERHMTDNEDILYPKWDKSHYKGGEAEYERLEKARKIHKDAADSSASWGMFQIMGFNYEACGEKNVSGFVNMMCKSELHQLLLSARFIRSGGMLPALQKKEWAEFAKRYNGPAYAQNKYDEKLAAAYKKFV